MQIVPLQKNEAVNHDLREKNFFEMELMKQPWKIKRKLISGIEKYLKAGRLNTIIYF